MLFDIMDQMEFSGKNRYDNRKARRNFSTWLYIVYSTIIIFIINISCAPVGLLSDHYPESFYQVERKIQENTVIDNNSFIVYSDNQAGWRVRDVFLKKSNWTKWQIALFPFYELYLVGNGVIGTINYFRHVPDYGSAERAMVRDAIYDQAKLYKAAFVLNLGDIAAHDGRRYSHWVSFLKENKIDRPFLNEIPYLPVIGNHENANNITYGYANFQAVFDYPRFYVIEFAEAVIFVIDSNYLIDQYDYLDNSYQDELFEKWFIAPQGKKLAWLEQQLNSYESKPFKIVAMHHPLISFSQHHDDWLNKSNGNDLAAKRKKLLELFKNYDVQVVFSGHDHLYQHNILKYGAGKQMHFLVGGGGGGHLRNLSSDEQLLKYRRDFETEGLAVSQVIQKKSYHYYSVEISADFLTIQSTEVTDNPQSPLKPIETIIIEKNKKE